MYREEAITSRMAFPRSKYRTKGDLESMALEGTSGRGLGNNRTLEKRDLTDTWKMETQLGLLKYISKKNLE